jgi:hypothetical protein
MGTSRLFTRRCALKVPPALPMRYTNPCRASQNMPHIPKPHTYRLHPLRTCPSSSSPSLPPFELLTVITSQHPKVLGRKNYRLGKHSQNYREIVFPTALLLTTHTHKEVGNWTEDRESTAGSKYISFPATLPSGVVESYNSHPNVGRGKGTKI